MAEKKITISNHLDQLEVLAGFIDGISGEWDLPANAALSLNLVLEELVSNSIFYGYDDRHEHNINICISFDNKTVQIQFEDDGREFNPLLYVEPDTDVALDDRKIGGLGIRFVRKIMDEIKYTRSDNKNILTMKKKII